MARHPSPENARPLLPANGFTLGLFAAYVVLAAVGAVAIAEAHVGHGPWWGLLYAAALAGLLGFLLFRSVPRVWTRTLSIGAVWAAVLLAVAVADQVHYRHAQGKVDPLTTAMALELPARALLHGREPYGVALPGGAPVSPGPGWILLLLPATAAGLTGLLGMAALSVAVAVLWRRDRTSAGLFCVLMLVQPLFESQAANGQDLYVVSLALVTCALLLNRYGERRDAAAWLGVLSGFVATARMPMVAILMVPGVGLLRRDRRAGAAFLATMLGVTAALNGAFAVWARRSRDWFQPMHVFGRGTYQAGHASEVVVAVLGAGAIAWVLLRMGDRASDWIFGMWLLMSALFIPEAVKELVMLRYDWRWEGSNYFTFPLPLLVAVIVLQTHAMRAPSERIAD